jgi:hypothetical protein
MPPTYITRARVPRRQTMAKGRDDVVRIDVTGVVHPMMNP